MSRSKVGVSGWLSLIFGLVFLYLPMVLLIIYSFNESRLVTVWSGFSFKWYGELFRDQQMMKALGRSIEIAALSATSAVVMGTLAGWVLTRFKRFKGRKLFSGMMSAPLVMPDVVIGLAMLLMFVSLKDLWFIPDQRGMTTIWIAHVTFCMAYVAVVVTGRLNELNPSIEEAAQDLGAAPWEVFFQIILPMIAPALLAGWLLAFTLSLDDLVIASFVTGPSSTTLPMLVFSSVKFGVSPKINALATLMILAVTIGCLVAWWLSTRKPKQL